MQIVQAGTLLPPNVCFICEEHQHEGTLVDTFRVYAKDTAWPLAGRKYVCERCVKEMARQYDLVDNADVRAAQLDLEKLKAEFDQYKQSLSKFVKGYGLSRA